ncbi:MAG: HAMP domain-containing histidine kinase [Butyrivibrio sp.]|nr:HAMP domain-containing histidine kinase [Ruminococcus flavefaciens]MCM1560783.1 HAMP domain-containing histidine kinase [Butyrivibrio sp.]
METLKKKWENLPLRSFLTLTVCLSIGAVVLASALIIGGCAAFRRRLLPDANAAYLTLEETLSDGGVIESTYLLNFGEDLSSLPSINIEYDDIPVSDGAKQTRYSIRKIETGVDSLSPKRKLAYQLCGAAMFAAPTILSLAAILWCCMYFYRRKLKTPLSLLADATKQIAEQNLDFQLSYHCGDEMGKLCQSFEDMRAALCENNKALWNMLEERKLMQASIAHDLRNPIAIIEGYSEYLEASLQNGEISREKAIRIAGNLGMAAKRLEQYTESVRLLNQTEETQLDRKPVNAKGLAAAIAEDLSLLAQKNGIGLQAVNRLPEKVIQVDAALLYRVLENNINNAIRYAREQIQLDFSLNEAMLSVSVTDDGEGFPAELLDKQERKLIAADKGGHMGIGLSVSRLLCRKHGGRLELSNTSEGACVKIFLSV